MHPEGEAHEEGESSSQVHADEDRRVIVNPGIPGPPMPAEPQRPLYLDEVCLFYPELKIVMAHGADPWWGEAIPLLLKYPNLS